MSAFKVYSLQPKTKDKPHVSLQGGIYFCISQLGFGYGYSAMEAYRRWALWFR